MKPWTWQRIAEAVLIALATSLVTSFTTVKVLEERTNSLKDDIQGVRSTVSALDLREQRHHDSVQESLRQIYALLVQRRSGG